MLILPYRATVFLDCGSGESLRLEMMERHFQKEADAIAWCKTMTVAQTEATGSWMVASSKGGRSLIITRAAGFPVVAEPSDYDGIEQTLASPALLSRQEGLALTSRN